MNTETTKPLHSAVHPVTKACWEAAAFAPEIDSEINLNKVQEEHAYWSKKVLKDSAAGMILRVILPALVFGLLACSAFNHFFPRTDGTTKLMLFFMAFLPSGALFALFWLIQGERLDNQVDRRKHLLERFANNVDQLVGGLSDKSSEEERKGRWLTYSTPEVVKERLIGLARSILEAKIAFRETCRKAGTDEKVTAAAVRAADDLCDTSEREFNELWDLVNSKFKGLITDSKAKIFEIAKSRLSES